MHRYCLRLAAISVLAMAATSVGAQTAATQTAPATTAPAATTTAPATPTTPTPAPPLTAEERQRLVAAAQRGVQLFELARAAQATTQDMLSRIPDPSAAGVSGWVAAPEGEGLSVVYYADAADGPVAVYRGQVVGGRVTARDVFTGADRPALTTTQRRMAAARAAVAGLPSRPCAGDFNVFVIPPASAEAPVEVYKLTPQTQRGRYPLGGHFLATVAPDGSIASSRAFTNSCVDLDVPVDALLASGNATPARPLGVTHLLDPLPTEIHVFLSLWMNRPLLVATGEPTRLWTVARGRIGVVGGARTPPPGPGR